MKRSQTMQQPSPKTEDELLIQNAFKNLLKACGSYLTLDEKKLIKQAFELGNNEHKDVKRKSGEPYILHPIAVAKIVVQEIGLPDYVAIIAALLHDIVEDTPLEVSDVRRMFGEKVARIVDGLTKISEVVDPASTRQAETFRKMLLTMSDDIRVALIKIADRLHNMRTADSLSREKQLRMASETMYIYAPLAHRLGLYVIKSELEDLSLKFLEPAVYQEISTKLIDSEHKRNLFIANFIKPIKEKLIQSGLKFSISSRVKSINSIYEKIKKQNIKFEEVYDIFAIRIILDPPITEEKEVCFKTLDLVHSVYHPIPSRFREWITTPKANGYEALHTTVIAGDNKVVEVQIRTKRMDYLAEKGLAAHWKYKQVNKEGLLPAHQQQHQRYEQLFEQWVNKIREVIETRKMDAVEFFNTVKSNVVSDQIYVYTPKGELIILNAGATALDLAYQIHTNIGNHCIGAKVNHQVVNMRHVLQNGDHVEILTSSKRQVSVEWLDFVTTHRAKTKILEATKEERKNIRNRGKAIFDWSAVRLGISLDHPIIKDLFQTFKVQNEEDFYYLLGSHRIDLKKIQNFISSKKNKLNEYDNYKNITEKTESIDEYIKKTKGFDADALILGKDIEHNNYVLASCCAPIPGDEIIGYASSREGLVIHRTSCIKAIELMTGHSKRIFRAKWNDQNHVDFLIGIRLVGQDRRGMLNDIVRVISGFMRLNIRSITIDSENGGFDGVIKLYVNHIEELNSLIEKLREISGIFNVTRLSSDN